MKDRTKAQGETHSLADQATEVWARLIEHGPKDRFHGWSSAIAARRRGDAEAWAPFVETFFEHADKRGKVLALVEAGVMIQRTDNAFRARYIVHEQAFKPVAHTLFDKMLARLEDSNPLIARQLEQPVEFRGKSVTLLNCLTRIWNYTDQLQTGSTIPEALSREIQELKKAVHPHRLGDGLPAPRRA